MISIKFKNWDKHQPRKDYKHPWWFAMANDFPIDQKLCDFNNDEKLCLIFLLCEASKQAKNGELTIKVNYWCKLVNMNAKVLMQVIEKIESVQIAYRICTGSVPTEQNRTEQNNNTSSKADAVAPEFDLENLYQSYPRKIGKQVGLKNLAKIIKSDKDYQEFKLAINNYSSLVSKEDKKYIKHFSSFVGTLSGDQPWRDFIEIPIDHKNNKTEINYGEMESEYYDQLVFQ